jgi:hypothetical protein
MTRFFALALGLAASAVGCRSGLYPVVADSSIRKPGHLQLFMNVEDGAGNPAPGIPAGKFRLFEDGKPISASEGKIRIWNPTLEAAHFVMVLVDTSGSVSTSSEASRVVASARDFASRIAGPVHRVGVYRFDGKADIEKLSDFGSDPKAAFADEAKLRPRDISTNLNGAILEALGVLETEREGGTIPLHFASLVVFTDGTDRAKRVTPEAAQEAIWSTDIDVFLVAVPGEIDLAELRQLAKSGLFQYPAEIPTLHTAFDTLKTRVETIARSFYFVSYCSPARAGEHDLDIEVEEENPPSGKPRKGLTSFRFAAEEFETGCEPLDKPNFDWHARYRRVAGEEPPKKK